MDLEMIGESYVQEGLGLGEKNQIPPPILSLKRLNNNSKLLLYKLTSSALTVYYCGYARVPLWYYYELSLWHSSRATTFVTIRRDRKERNGEGVKFVESTLIRNLTIVPCARNCVIGVKGKFSRLHKHCESPHFDSRNMRVLVVACSFHAPRVCIEFYVSFFAPYLRSCN